MTESTKRETQELAQLAEHFRQVTDRFIAETARKLELARATGNEEAVVKEHIKGEESSTGHV